MGWGGGKSCVLIIDNASKDLSVERLEKKYAGLSDIEILRIEENVGFSRANNMGYIYMKKKNIDFLFVCNSDIEFRQVDFEEKLLNIYKSTEFHICGPDVYAPNMVKSYYHGHQSPTYPWEYTVWYTKYNIFSQETSYEKVNKLNIRYGNIKRIYCLFIKCMQRVLCKTIYLNFRKKYHANTSIHGSCIILSRKFLDTHSVLFEVETNFYYEELLLFLQVKKEKLVSIYDPSIQIIHFQGRSTNNKIKESKNNDWVKKNLIESGYIYLNELRNMKKQIINY